MNPKDWLLGKWQKADEDSAVIFEISKDKNCFNVRVYSKDDNEEHVVSNTKWDGKALRFETLVPSNKWRTGNRLTVISKTKAIHELTYWEPWKRTLPKTARQGSRKSKSGWLVGRWQNCEGYIDVLFNVDKAAKGFRVQAFEECNGEKIVVSKVKWDGKVLSLDAITPSTKWRTRNRLKVVSKQRAVHEITIWEDWRKLPPT